MPNWINKTKFGTLVCVLCGSQVIQTLGIWSCLDRVCEKHTDIPTEKQQGFAGRIISEFAVGTTPAASGSISPSQEIEERGEY